MILLNCTNLLGDTLYLLKPLGDFHMTLGQEHRFAVGVMPGFAGDMVRRQFGHVMRIGLCDVFRSTDVVDKTIDVTAGAAAQICVRHLLAFGRRMHISEGYAQILGVDPLRWCGDMRPLAGWSGRRWDEQRADNYVLIAPFSRSCSRWAGMRPNKTPDHVRWTPLFNWIYAQGYVPKVLVGEHEEWLGEDVETVHASSLSRLIDFLCSARAVVTVDNGIGHVASALGCRTVILWPPITSVDFIGPKWNPGTTLLYMRPERVRGDQLKQLVSEQLEPVCR